MPKQKKEKTQEDIDRNNLLNYFISVCCEKINYAVYNKQLKEIKQQYKDYTYKGMQYCLWYIHEHQKIPIKSIAIVPYYYEESKKYYQWLKDIKKSLKEYNMELEKEKIVIRQEMEENIFE